MCDDYITEKLWRAFHIGVVPVVFGSPRVKVGKERRFSGLTPTYPLGHLIKKTKTKRSGFGADTDIRTHYLPADDLATEPSGLVVQNRSVLFRIKRTVCFVGGVFIVGERTIFCYFFSCVN